MSNRYKTMLEILKLLEQDDEDDDEEFETLSTMLQFNSRNSILFRKRWDSDYLLDLAQKEGSFLAEYRLTPRLFSVLHDLIEDRIATNDKMESLVLSSSGSRRISTASRLGAALIILSGGRIVEAMRTHGISKPFAYNNLESVVEAINACPNLAIICDNSPLGLTARAQDFEYKSLHSLLKVFYKNKFRHLFATIFYIYERISPV